MSRSLKAAFFLGLTAVSWCQQDCSQLLPQIPVSKTAKADLAGFVKDIGGIQVAKVGDSLSVFGPNAFPLMIGSPFNLPVGAGGRFGKGRLVGFANENVLLPAASQPFRVRASSGLNTLLYRTVNWLAGGTAKEGAVVGDLDALADRLEKFKIDFTKLNFAALKSYEGNLNSFQFILIRDFIPADVVPVLQKYLENGGGLAIAFTTFFFKGIDQFYGKPETFPANILSRPFGFVWRVHPDQVISNENEPDEKYNTSLSYYAGTTLPDQWNQLRVLNTELPDKLIQTFELQIQAVPKSEIVKMGLYSAALNFVQKCSVPSLSRSNPAKTAEIKNLIRLFDIFTSAVLDPKDVIPSPSSYHFPGRVSVKPSNKFTRTLTFRKEWNEWISTGLYAPNGGVISAKIHGISPSKSVQVVMQIGCHTEDLSDQKEWSRPPKIVRKTLFINRTAVLNSPYGGNIYIYTKDVENTGQGPFTFTFEGAVASPRFKLGETSLKQWREVNRKAPGAWAELESKQVIITVPTSNISKLDDPESLLKLWDKWTLAEKELMGSSTAKAERAVSDLQLAHGYLHAGYPMMGHMEHAELAVDLPKLTNKAGENWGWLHEIGHNLQDYRWTFQGTIDKTNNVLVVYALSTVSGTKEEDMHGDLRRDEYLPRVRKYIDDGVKFETFKTDDFLGLQYYLQLQRAFGWNAYKKTFAAYNALSQDQNPNTNEEKMDMWIVFFSKTVKQNLIEFHKSWGFPIGDGVAKQLEQYPMSALSITNLL